MGILNDLKNIISSNNVKPENIENKYSEYAPGQNGIKYTKELAIPTANNYCKQIVESINICKSTLNVKTFFSRYGLALHRTVELQRMGNLVKLKEDPKKTEQYLLDNRDDEINGLIDRISWDLHDKNNKLKKPKSEKEVAESLRSKFVGYEKEMTPSSLEHLEYLTRNI